MQTELYSSVIWILVLLFAAFLVVGLFGDKLKAKASGAISTLAILFGAVISYSTAWSYFFSNGLIDGKYQMLIPFQTEWLRFTETMAINLGIMID